MSVSPPRTRATPASATSEAANVIVDGPCSSPARVSSARSATPASGFSRPFVTDTTKGGRRAARQGLGQPHDLGAPPDWLTTTSSGRGPSAGTAEVQHLGGVGHDRRDARARPARVTGA